MRIFISIVFGIVVSLLVNVAWSADRIPAPKHRVELQISATAIGCATDDGFPDMAACPAWKIRALYRAINYIPLSTDTVYAWAIVPNPDGDVYDIRVTRDGKDVPAKANLNAKNLVNIAFKEEAAAMLSEAHDAGLIDL